MRRVALNNFRAPAPGIGLELALGATLMQWATVITIESEPRSSTAGAEPESPLKVPRARPRRRGQHPDYDHPLPPEDRHS